jgi:hypothetical protein
MPWRRTGEWRCNSTHSLASALDGGKWSASRPCRFTPRERAPGTHWIGGWMGPRAVSNVVVKRKIPSPSRESDPRTPIVQPVAQRYTDWAITALYTHTISFVNHSVVVVVVVVVVVIVIIWYVLNYSGPSCVLIVTEGHRTPTLRETMKIPDLMKWQTHWRTIL